MDWAKTVKTTRKRLKMNQEVFAELLGISQTTVSRIESGAAEPTDEVVDTLQALRINPLTRSIFDDFVASIEHSPYASFLALPEDDGFSLEAISAELRTTFGTITQRLNDLPGAAPLIMHLEALLSRGFDTGRIESAVGVWADSNKPQGHWRVVYSPMRDGTGAWYVFAALMKTSESDYETHRAEHEGGLEITTYSREA